MNGPIKIAALFNLTGDAAAWGENAQKAVQLATDEVNKSGGINGRQVEVLYEDTAADPKKAVSAFQQAVSVERVTAVMGPLNQSEDAAVLPLIDQTHTPTIIPGYLPLQDRTDLSNPLIIWMDAQTEAARIAQYVYAQGIHTVAVIGTLDAWESTVSKAFADAFVTAGGTVTDTEIVQPTSADMRLPVTRAVASKPQGIFIGTYYQFIHSTQVLHDLGYKGKLFSIEVDDYLAGETSGSSDGLQFIAPDYYSQAFIKKFTDAYGQAPGLPAGQSYDAAQILFSFLQKGAGQESILSSMKSFTGYEGVSGQLTIGSDGRTTLPTALFEVDKGKVNRIQSLP